MTSDVATTPGVLASLQGLIAASANGREAYAWVADHAASSEVRRTVQRHELRWAANAMQLEHICTALRGRHDEATFAGLRFEFGPLQRTWLNLRAMLGRDGDRGLVRMCLRGERVNLQRFEQALAHDLPGDLRDVLAVQRDGIERACLDMEALIDRLDGG